MLLILQVIVRREINRAEQKVDHSKASTSVLFSWNAAGEILPPMVVYKAKFLYDGWVSGSPNGAIYVVLILIGLMDEHASVGSKNYFFQIWIVMALFAIIGQLLELLVLGSMKRSWRSLQKLLKNYISQATFSTAFERPFEWHKTWIFDQWVLGNRNIST